MLCAWVAVGTAFLFYGYLGPRALPPAVEGGATFPMIKEMANFVEPYLPPGFRTRLQGRGGDTGRFPSPHRPLRRHPPRRRLRTTPSRRPNRRSELSLMARQAVPSYNPAVSSAPKRLDHDLDKFHEECALFGIYGTSDAAAHTALGLHALQHRGQEASGIVTFDGRHFHNHRAAGLVGDIFGEQSIIAKLKGYSAIGHNRYATTGGSSDRNIQPIFADFDFGGLALAHNGNLTNAYLLRKELVRIGCLFQSTTDTEVINHLIARSNYSTVVDRVIDALGRVKGAYSLLMLTNEALLGVRDPMGVRPLVIGRLEDSWILTSESCALDIIGARFVRDVEPGEIVIVDGNGLRSIKPFTKEKRRFCVFEHIYFARPDSKVEGIGVYDARKRIGMQLATRKPGAGRRRRAGARFGRAGGDRLCRSVGPAVRARHHPQSLCRPHLHRAGRPHPPSRRAAEAQRQPRPYRGQARHPGRRFDRARHDLDEDRRDGAQCRRPRGAHAHRRPADHRSLLLRHRHAASARSFWPRATTSPAWRSSSASIRSPSCRSTGSIAPWACPAAIRTTRASATPASPATIRSRSTT